MKVVKRGFEIVSEGSLAATLGLPPDTIPPGAEKNPEFVESLFQPGASLQQLVETNEVPEALAEEMPEGEIVEMPTLKDVLATGEGMEHAIGHMAHGGNEAAEALEHNRYFKTGGKVFKVVSVAYAVYRIYEAPHDEKAAVAGEEVGRLGGEYGGARAGTSACLVLAPETEGASLIVCGIVGSMFGEEAGEKVGEKVLTPIFDVIMNILDAPETIAHAMDMVAGALNDLADGLHHLNEAERRLIGSGLMSLHEKMQVDNWDLRDVPPALQADVRAVGGALWRRFADLQPTPFLLGLDRPLADLGVPGDAVARIAAALAGLQTGPGYTAETLLAMKPLDFVRAMQGLGLAFVQDPNYTAGFWGRWGDEAQLNVRLEPLLRSRATVNTGNWNLSHAKAVNFDDGRDVDLGPAVKEAGDVAWSQLEPMRELQLDEALGKTMADFGLAPQAAADIAEGVNGTTTNFTQLDADALLQSTPESFVGLLTSYGLPLTFAREPGEVAQLGLAWVRAGFEPW